MSELAVWLNVVPCLFLTGLIWFVQIVHYPLFLRIPAEKIALFAEEHSSRTTLVVAPAMLVELAASLLLLFHEPAGFSLAWRSFLAALTMAIFASTFAIQVPLHARIAAGDLTSIPRLIASNWLRTILWSIRSVSLIWLLTQRA